MEQNKVFAYVDDHKDELAGFLSQIIQIPSLNEGVEDSGDERKMGEFLADYYSKLGLETKVVAVDKEGKRSNVIGIYKGTGGGENIILNAHMDTVPITNPEEWIYPPLSGKIVDGKVYGRGANDCKQGIAAMTYAVKALQAAGVKLRGDVILLASCGEESNEGGVYGAGRAIKEAGLNASFAIVGEGTNMEIDIESSSLCFFELVVKGKPIHVSARNQAVFPQAAGVPSGSSVGVDALAKALPIINMLYAKERDWNLNTMRSKVVGAGGIPAHDKAGVGAFTINPCDISGGTYLGSLMGEVRIKYSIWHDNRISLEEIKAEIERDVAAIASTDSWLRENPPIINMPILQTWQGFRTDRNHPGVKTLEEAFKEVTGRDAIITGMKAVCDSTYINEQGIPSVVLGPGSLENGVHGTNEFCYIDSLVEATKVYASMILKWCK